MRSEYFNGRGEDGTLDLGRVMAVDLDGVILRYEGWRGPEQFGDVVPGAVETLRKLRRQGWYIVIFTSRLVSVHLVDYLSKLKVPYDDINGRVVPMPDAAPEVRRRRLHTISFQEYGGPDVNYGSVCGPEHYWSHNPPQSSIKPIASVYVDDMNWENGGRQYDESTWAKLYESIQRRFPFQGKELEDDGY